MTARTNIFEPDTSVLSVPDRAVASVSPKISTIVAQMLVAGTATSGVLLEDIDLNSADALFGAGSMAAEAARNFWKYNEVSTLNVIPLDDLGGGTAATGLITVTGTTAAANGEYDIYIGSKDTVNKATAVIVATDTPTLAGDKIEAAINALDNVTVTAANVAGVVTLTAKNAGTVANEIGILVEGTIDDLAVAVTLMASGAGDPSMIGIVDLLPEKTDIIIPFEYGITDFITELDSRFQFNNVANDGRLFTAITDTKSNLVTTLGTENSKSLVVFCDKPVSKTLKTGSAIFEMPLNKAAQFASVRSLRLEDNQAIGDYVVTTAANDQRGGVHTSSLPYHNTPMLQMPVIPTGEGFTDADIIDIQNAGGALMGNNRVSNTIITGRIRTAYKTNGPGLVDKSYRFLNYVDEDTATREFYLFSLLADFAQSRLTVGTAVNNYDIATLSFVQGKMMEYFGILAGPGYVLLQSGEIGDTGNTVEDIFKDRLDISFDMDDGFITINGINPIYTQVRGISTVLQLKFDPRTA